MFDIGSDVSDTADATVQLEQTTDGMEGTIVRNENVESFTLSGPIDANMSDSEDGEDADRTVTSVGDVAVYPESYTYNTDGDTSTEQDGTESLSDGDSISVVAELEDGSTEVLTSSDYSA